MKASSRMNTGLLASLADGTLRPAAAAQRVVRKPALLSELLAGVRESKARVKFGSAKALLLLSEQSPATVLPAWDQVTALLDSEWRPCCPGCWHPSAGR